MADTEPLKPCPFCGAAAFTNEYQWLDRSVHPTRAYRQHEVVCRGEDDEHSLSRYDTEAEAVAAWNRRVPPSP